MLLKMNGQRVYEITSGYLQKENFRDHPHMGVDLKLSVGTPIHSPVNGTISNVVDYGHSNIGKGVFVQTDDHQTLILGHLSKIDPHIHKGTVVQIGDNLGLSGNTGNVVGHGHLHIGLKDASGHFVNPTHVEQSFQEVTKEMSNHEHLGILGASMGGIGVNSQNPFSGIGDFMNYIHTLKTQGFFMATFDKTPKDFFFGWMFDALKHGLHFILENDEAFFILPAVVILFATFLAGRNKFTKWVVPLWLAYFASAILTETSGIMEWLMN